MMFNLSMLLYCSYPLGVETGSASLSLKTSVGEKLKITNNSYAGYVTSKYLILP